MTAVYSICVVSIGFNKTFSFKRRSVLEPIPEPRYQYLLSSYPSIHPSIRLALHTQDNYPDSPLQVNFSSSLDSGPDSATSSNDGVSQSQHLPLVALSPIIHPRIREFRSGPPTTAAPRRDVPASPPLSLHERYSSPAAGSAKRRLFGDDTLPQFAEAAASTCGSPAPSPAKRLTFGGGGGSGGTLRIGALPTQTTVLSIPLQGDT